MELHTVVENHFEFCVLRVKIVGEALAVKFCPVFCQWEVVVEAIAASLWRGGRYFVLLNNPLQALDGDFSHALRGPFLVAFSISHNHIHASHAAHRANIYYILLHALAVAKPGGHEVLDGVHCGRVDPRLLVRLGDSEVEGDEPIVFARYVDARLEHRVVDSERTYNFHNFAIKNDLCGFLLCSDNCALKHKATAHWVCSGPL